MRGQPENPLDLGIGKKVEPKTAPKDPWVKEKPGVYRNTETGAMETRIPGNESAKRQADPVIEAIRELLRSNGIRPSF